VHDGTVAIADFDASSNKVAIVLPDSDFFHLDQQTDSKPLTANVAAIPDEYRRFPGLAIYNLSSIAFWHDRLLVGYGGTSYLVEHSLGGEPLDTLTIPRLMRIGTPASGYRDLLSRSGDFRKQAKAVSLLKRMWPTSDGGVILWHQDNEAEQLGNDVQVLGRAWISLLSPSLDSACVDAPLGFPGSGWPRVAVSGDTVLALDQITPRQDSTKVVTVLRRYRLDTTGCRWLPIRHSTKSP
jgi:hypothetical protein